MAMLAAVHLVVAFLVPPPGLVAPPGASRRAVLRMNEPPSGEVKIVSDDTYKLMMKALLCGSSCQKPMKLILNLKVQSSMSCN